MSGIRRWGEWGHAVRSAMLHAARRLGVSGGPIAAVVLCLMGSLAHATEGNEIIGLGPIQKGTAGAGVASAADAAWTLLNPAAITELDSRLDVYVDFLFVHRSLEPRGLVGNTRAGEMHHRDVIGAPGIGYIWKHDPFTMGFGMYAAAGTGVEFPEPRSILGIPSNSDRRAILAIIRVPFTIAREFDNGWALGFTLQGNINAFRTDNITLNLRPAQGDNTWDPGYGLGFVLGVQKTWDRWKFGASYASRQWTTGFGEYDDLILYSLDQPQKLQIGLAHQVTPRLELLLDYKLIDWASVDQFGKSGIQGGLGWKSQHLVKGGFRFEANERWTFRGGFSHGNSPITRKHVFTNALFPAITRTHAAAGVSYQWNERFAVNLSYSRAFHNAMTDSGRGDLFSNLGRGTKIALDNDSVQVGASWKF